MRDIFDQRFKQTDFGYQFKYSKKDEISKSKELSYVHLITIGKEKFNANNLTILCKSCGNYMNFVEDKNSWICPTCGLEVNEIEAYNKLDAENESWLDEHGLNDCSEEIQECCQACGGPYPDCKISCKVFNK